MCGWIGLDWGRQGDRQAELAMMYGDNSDVLPLTNRVELDERERAIKMTGWLIGKWVGNGNAIEPRWRAKQSKKCSSEAQISRSSYTQLCICTS